MLALPVREIMDVLKAKIIGQDNALKKIEEVLTVTAAGIGDPNKPLATLYFAGPTGVGKTETVAALAEAIHGDRNKRCKVNCNQLQDTYSTNSLTGAPPGYVGFQEKATLLKKDLIEGTPGRPGILVFEEAEKAHPNIWELLLGLDDAEIKFNFAQGKSVNLANTIIVLTSNIGAKELSEIISGKKIGFENLFTDLSRDALARKIVKSEMEKTFAPEFIGRLDEVVVFDWLTLKDAEKITGHLIKNLSSILQKKRNSRLYISQDAIRFIAEKGFNSQLGARPLKQAFRKIVEYPLAKIITEDDCCYVHFEVKRNGDELMFLKKRIQISGRTIKNQPLQIAGAVGMQIQHGNITITLPPKEGEMYKELMSLVNNDENLFDYFVNLSPNEFIGILKLAGNTAKQYFRSIENFKKSDPVIKKDLFHCCVMLKKKVYKFDIFRKNINMLVELAATY